MKAKHLLFSSMVLSMGFAACTNEVEEFAPQNQVKDYPGVELGKDFVINVNNSDFSADAETRAAFVQNETTWIPAWEENDAIGAAWFNKFKLDENGKIADPKDVWSSLGEYGSNAKFVWQGGQKFQSEAISKLGAYVLYYPYNVEITDNMTEIPVVEIPSTQPFDVKDQTAQVTNNITAANVVVFGESGDQAPEFTIKQIPNLYALSFYLADEALLSLANEVEITHVMVEVENSVGEGLIYTNGIIKPSSTIIDVDTYNNEEGADPMPGIKFVGDEATKTNRMIVEVSNPDADEAYYITEIGKENKTKQFFFSMLPVDDTDITTVKFKIIAKIGDRTKVFEKKITDMTKSYIAKMSETGEVINLTVGLDNEGTIEGLYSVAQFVEAWKAKETTFEFAVPMDLSELSKEDVDFENVEKHIVFSGEKVTLPSIKGKYTFYNDVEIKGDATFVNCAGCTEEGHSFTASTENLTIDGKLNVEGSTKAYGFYGTINVAGDVTVDGPQASFDKLTAKDIVAKSAVKLSEKKAANVGNITAIAPITFTRAATTGTIDAQANVTFAAGATTDAITVAEGATVTFSGVAKTKGINANGEVIFNGTEATIEGDVIANADITATKAAITGSLTATDVTVGAAELTVSEKITLAEEAELTVPTLTAKDIELDTYSVLNANTKFEVTGTLNAKGSVDATATSAIKTLNIADGVTVDLGTTAKIENLTVNKKGDYYGTLNAGDLTVVAGINDGVINATNCTINGTFNQNATLEAAIVVAKDAENGIDGILNVNTDMTSNITNNGTINVAANKTLSGIVNNNANINVNGKLIETADGDFIIANTSYIKVENNGELAFVADNTRDGIVEIMQNSKFKNIVYSTVKFEWTANNVPNETAHEAVVDQVYINGATYSDANQRPFFKYKDLYLNGDLTLAFGQSVTEFVKNTGKLVIEKNCTLKSTYPLTLFLPDAAHEIKDGVTFKTDNVTLDATTSVSIKAGKGYTFDGEKTSNVTITQ